MEKRIVASPLGSIELTADEQGLRTCEFVPGGLDAGNSSTHLDQAERWLEAYFAGQPLPTLPTLAAEGSPFFRSVWQALAAIPYGATQSYGDIARAIGKPRAFRAVGLANHRNPIALLVPCHRVVGSQGDLTGYASGLERKSWLLEHERRWLEEATERRT